MEQGGLCHGCQIPEEVRSTNHYNNYYQFCTIMRLLCIITQLAKTRGGNPEVWFRCAISANYNFVIIMCFLYNHYVSQHPQATGGILRWGEILAKGGECPPPPLPPSPT